MKRTNVFIFEMLRGGESLQQHVVSASLVDSFGSRLLRGLSWLLIGNVASRICMLIASVVTARTLGQTAFGEYGIITPYLVLFTKLVWERQIHVMFLRFGAQILNGTIF